ncbi:MAG: endonuclease V [Hadesarchaea archaeon]|nr:endonuclease V [Hadesarchaea archaeon]
MLDILKPKTTNLDELSKIQNKVANLVVKEDKTEEINTIAGCDISFSQDEEAYAASVLLDFDSLEVIDNWVKKVKVDFPYIPTYLAFRELEPMLKVLNNVKADVYMLGAQGIAHPRRAGLASHLGVIIDKPALGVAKNILCGEAKDPDPEKGSYKLLKDNGETIGAVVRTRSNVKPVYVSIGHKISLGKAIEVTLETSPKYKLPEPIRAAHNLATKRMKEDS